MPWSKYSLGVSLDEGLLRLLYLRGTWRGKEVLDRIAVNLPPSQGEEAPLFQEVQKFLLKNAVGPSAAVVFSIPRKALLFRRLTTPPVKEKDVKALVKYESERHLPGREEEFTLGFQDQGRTAEGGHRLLLAAARREGLDEQLGLLHRMNLDPVSLQPAPMALAAAFRHLRPDTPPALVVTIGISAFTADYIEKGRLYASRHFHLAAGKVVDADSLAEEVKLKLTQPLFLETLPGGALPPLWLHGSTAAEGNFAERLGKLLPVPVEMLPAAPPGGEEVPAGTAWSIPFGCALLGMEEGRSGLEMSEERAESLMERPGYRTTSALALALLALLAVQFGLHSFRHHRHLGRIEKEITSMKEDKAAVEALSLRVARKRERFEFLSGAMSAASRIRQAELLRELTSLIPEDTYLSNYTFRDGEVKISGFAPSASRLLSLLEESPLFKDAKFSSAIVAQGKTHERFTIQLQLEVESG